MSSPEPDGGPTIAALVIAAQPGRGFERIRWLGAWGTTTLLEHVLADVGEWPVDERILVLGADAELVLDTVSLEGLDVIVDPEWEEGESASLRSGIDHLTRSSTVEAVVVADAATPGVTADTVAELIAAHREQERPVTIGKYRYTQAWPVVVDRDLWPRLLGFEGPAGISTLVDTHPAWVHEHRFDRLPPRSAATPDDLAALSPRR